VYSRTPLVTTKKLSNELPNSIKHAHNLEVLNKLFKKETICTVHPEIKKLVGKNQFQDFLSSKWKNDKFKATHFRIICMCPGASGGSVLPLVWQSIRT
jgi:hypothetical protein